MQFFYQQYKLLAPLQFFEKMHYELQNEVENYVKNKVIVIQLVFKIYSKGWTIALMKIYNKLYTINKDRKQYLLLLLPS